VSYFDGGVESFGWENFGEMRGEDDGEAARQALEKIEQKELYFKAEHSRAGRGQDLFGT